MLCGRKKRAAFKAKKYGEQGQITNQAARLPSVPLITHTNQPAQPQQRPPPTSEHPYPDEAQPGAQARYGRRGSTQSSGVFPGAALNDVSNHSAARGGQAAAAMPSHYQQAPCAQQ